MSPAITPRSPFLLLLAAWVVGAAGCVHPLGPGYHFPDRQAEIQIAGASPQRIHIRVTDLLTNAGDRPLHSLEVRLPVASEFGAQNLHMQVAGAEVSPQNSSRIDVRMMSAPFNPVWEQGDNRTVVTEWDIAPQLSVRGTIAAAPEGFFIADETALPLWQTPHGVFPRGGTLPEKELLTLIAPSDFRVIAPGKPIKRGAESSQVVQRFLINPDEDFVPYVVAGRYQVRVIHASRGDVQFWMFHPVDTAIGQTVADRLSSSMAALEDFFGPAPKGKATVRVVESPVELPSEFSTSGDQGAVSFPQGVLLDPHALQQAVVGEDLMELAEYELTRTWYGWRVRPRPEAEILMGRGVGLFGLVITAEARGQDQRSRMVSSLIDRYDQARAVAPDRRLMEPPAGYSRAERIATGYRAALFFVALEDACGRDNLQDALRDILYARASSDTSYEELRAGLESASRKDLAEMFRIWLVRPGIPEDFRNRYTKQ